MPLDFFLLCMACVEEGKAGTQMYPEASFPLPLLPPQVSDCMSVGAMLRTLWADVPREPGREVLQVGLSGACWGGMPGRKGGL